MEYERIVESANLINVMVEYIVDRAVKSRSDMQTYEWLLSMDADSGSRRYIQELYDPSTAELPSMEKKSLDVKKDSALYPAISYMDSHPTEMITMKSMAELCHLSESYFSRLFSKELGENFSTYINRKKIERSKKLLRDSQMSVSQIAKEVGYQDAGHYIRLFKRFEGVTPTIYRQYNYK